MKKILSIVVLLFMCAGMAKAEGVTAPQWNEFCPGIYVDVQPARFDKDKNYWYERRIQFNETMKQAEQYKGQELLDFYEKVRKSEAEKNRNWAKEVGAHNKYTEREQQKSNQYNTFFSNQQLFR